MGLGITYEMPTSNMGEKTMVEDTKKKKNPSKKELMRKIEKLDTGKLFDLVSLNRTNIANINAVVSLLEK